MTDGKHKPTTGQWPKHTTVPLNNVSQLVVVEESDGGILLRLRGSYNLYAARHIAGDTEIDLEPRP
jgi:hypothetical protein